MLTILDVLRSQSRRHAKPYVESELRVWLDSMPIIIIYIESDSPWQKGHIESFHVWFRKECLDRKILWTLTEARVVIED